MELTAAKLATTFEEVLGRGADACVAQGVALLARDVYPDTDVRALLARFDGLAAPLKSRGLSALAPHAQAELLAAHLHGTLGFIGNQADYDDPRNSLLPDVLERRTGLPIALSLVYVEVGKRLGLRASGVGFPGHFLARLDGAPGQAPAIIDPFGGGVVLDYEALGKLFSKATGLPEPPALEPFLAPIRPRALLHRWLTNLRGAYLRRGELPRALVVLDRLVSLSPDDPAPLRDRGLLALKLGAPAAAKADLERVAALDPDSVHGAEARALLETLQTLATQPN